MSAAKYMPKGDKSCVAAESAIPLANVNGLYEKATIQRK